MNDDELEYGMIKITSVDAVLYSWGEVCIAAYSRHDIEGEVSFPIKFLDGLIDKLNEIKRSL